MPYDSASLSLPATSDGKESAIGFPGVVEYSDTPTRVDKEAIELTEEGMLSFRTFTISDFFSYFIARCWKRKNNYE